MQPISAELLAGKLHDLKNQGRPLTGWEEKPRATELLWAIQFYSWEPGGLKAFADELLKLHPQRVGLEIFWKFGRPKDGWNAKQFFYMVKYGLTPMQAIQAATVNGADLLGWNDKVGSISVGKFADIIAVSADPLQDVKVLENMEFVMKDGVVYKNLLTK